MSTRGCVARGTLERWQGVFCHWDNYPTYIGPRLWRCLRRRRGDVEAFLRWAIDRHPQGWDQFGERPYGKDESDMTITSEAPDPLFIEWAYVFDPGQRKLYILCSEINDGEPGAYNPMPILTDGWWDYGHCRCRHRLAATVDLGGQEPDWEAIQERSRRTNA